MKYVEYWPEIRLKRKDGSTEEVKVKYISESKLCLVCDGDGIRSPNKFEIPQLEDYVGGEINNDYKD